MIEALLIKYGIPVAAGIAFTLWVRAHILKLTLRAEQSEHDAKLYRQQAEAAKVIIENHESVNAALNKQWAEQRLKEASERHKFESDPKQREDFEDWDHAISPVTEVVND